MGALFNAKFMTTFPTFGRALLGVSLGVVFATRLSGTSSENFELVAAALVEHAYHRFFVDPYSHIKT